MLTHPLPTVSLSKCQGSGSRALPPGAIAPLPRPRLWVGSQPMWTTGQQRDPEAAGRGDWQTKPLKAHPHQTVKVCAPSKHPVDAKNSRPKTRPGLQHANTFTGKYSPGFMPTGALPLTMASCLPSRGDTLGGCVCQTPHAGFFVTICLGFCFSFFFLFFFKNMWL